MASLREERNGQTGVRACVRECAVVVVVVGAVFWPKANNCDQSFLHL